MFTYQSDVFWKVEIYVFCGSLFIPKDGFDGQPLRSLARLSVDPWVANERSAYRQQQRQPHLPINHLKPLLFRTIRHLWPTFWFHSSCGSGTDWPFVQNSSDPGVRAAQKVAFSPIFSSNDFWPFYQSVLPTHHQNTNFGEKLFQKSFVSKIERIENCLCRNLQFDAFVQSKNGKGKKALFSCFKSIFLFYISSQSKYFILREVAC